MGLRTLCTIVLLLSGCTPRPGTGPLRVTDDAGRVVALARPAERIVSLSPTFTEILFAIGAGDRVVGRTTWCDYPPAAESIPSVGDGLPPNVEAVAARRPDLVALYRSPATESAARQLEQLGIRTVLLRVDLLSDVPRAARLFAVLTGHQEAADSIDRILELARQLKMVERGFPRAATGPRVAFVVWDAPVIVIGRGSFLNELAALSGARNVFADLDAASAEVSLEALAVRDPDVIVVLGDSASALSLASPAWRVVRAVREHRLVHLSGSMYGRPSPRAGEAVAGFQAALAAALGTPSP